MSRLIDWWVNLRVERALALQLSILIALVLSCTVFVHLVEGWSWIDAAYFSVASVTTVGYGDLSPQHDATKVFLIFYLPMGIAVGFTTLTTMGAWLIDSQRRRLERRRDARSAKDDDGTPPDIGGEGK